ncbi:MAG: hypothetical protein M3Z17_03095 [Gemmatimonadota bacterium]|nr:hypothetical protein [Gemmatimonadota bacterium]
MSPLEIRIPAYESFELPGTYVIAKSACAASLKSVLEAGSLYDFAAKQPGAREFSGRAPVFAISLPNDCGKVVVRHATRGGMMSRISKDVFLRPTRGLRELLNSLRLRALGVSTPEVVACVTYHAGWMLRRSDVATQEIVGGHDLSVVLSTFTESGHRDMAIAAAIKLLRGLTSAGAYHKDLNLKNIVLTSDESADLEAHVLDVDRVRFSSPGSPLVAKANLGRLLRSLRKWRSLNGLPFTEEEAERLTREALEGIT